MPLDALQLSDGTLQVLRKLCCGIQQLTEVLDVAEQHHLRCAGVQLSNLFGLLGTSAEASPGTRTGNIG